MIYTNNYNNSIENSNEEDEIQKIENPIDKELDILKEKYLFKKQKVRSSKSPQVINETKNNIKNEIFLNELEKDNQRKEQELNIYKDILKKKYENIQKKENKLEKLNDDIIKEKNKLILNEFEINKKDLINKEEEINKLKQMNGTEKEKYENLKSKAKEEIDNLRENLKIYENKEAKLKELEDIEIEIKNKNKEMKCDEEINSNNELIAKNKDLEKEINKKK